MNQHPHPDLVGKTYVNPKDSGDLVIEVLSLLPLLPTDVIVSPVGYERSWPYNASVVRQLISDQEAPTMNDYRLAQRKIKSIVKRAIHERDTEGHRENLGYDQQNIFESFLNLLDLTYPEHAALAKEFDEACDQI